MRTVPAELVDRYEAEGLWTRDTLGQLLARGLEANPDVVFRVHSAVRPWEGTVRDVERVARRLAAGLRARGVGPGDVVALQLPNWMEAAAVFWATTLLGATVVPIVHFYGRKELAYILESTKPTVFVTTEKFGRTEFHADLCADVPIVGVVGRDFDELLADEPMEGVVATDPSEPALIAFTSGTTSNPKGVIHSHRTLGFEARQLAERVPADRGALLTAAPIGHFIGMVSAVLVPVLRDDDPIHLTDVWDPARVLALMLSDGITVGGGATYYMTSLLDHPDFGPEHLATMKYIGMGGSTVPAAVTRRLTDLGLVVFRSYGSTEHPSMTASPVTAPEAKRLYTDGAAGPAVEIRLAPDGEILSRGPDLCMGYTDTTLTEAVFDDDGWYHTGDIGTLDEDGYLTITDRKADFIIRGGENISALEVEQVLLTLPGVAEAVVVGVPDARLGEHAAALLRLREGAAMPTLAQMREHFDAAGLAKQKWPEELHESAEFPRTPSGKVQKFLVRKNLAAAREKGQA